MHTCMYHFFSAVSYSAKKFLCYRRQRLKVFSVVAYIAKKYELAIFRPKPSQFWIFWPSSEVTYPYRSDFCKKKPGAEYLKLGPL
jgi:hypothetical protein